MTLRKRVYLTLRAASLRYVEEDPNHIHKIVKLSKLDPDRTIRSLSEKEFEIYWKSIEENEGWTIGRELLVDKWYITGVHRKRGVIYEYRIQKQGQDVWLSKSDAISLATSNQLHAIIVHMKSGLCYLRPEYHTTPFSSLIV
ncbi:MAG TPA: hypothetical protein VLE96_01855 [Chlamydiales bacterium]|nr:hypothetical protein [Chlamydiales bacterium]